MSETRALGADGVLGDLTDDGLTGPDHLLDALVIRGHAIHVVRIERDVTLIEHRVLRNSDVDEGQFHAGQHVLDAAQVNVAVDLIGLVRVLRHGVLHHRAPLEGGDVRAVGGRVHGHEVATLGTGASLGAAPAATSSLTSGALGTGALGSRRLDRRVSAATWLVRLAVSVALARAAPSASAATIAPALVGTGGGSRWSAGGTRGSRSSVAYLGCRSGIANSRIRR